MFNNTDHEVLLAVGTCDDCVSPSVPTSSMPIMGSTWTSIRMTANGVITRGDVEFNSWRPFRFPYYTGVAMIAPFWADAWIPSRYPQLQH